MIVALVDNGSLEPAAHRHLRVVAEALSRRANVKVHAVSWKHSDRIAPAELDDVPAWTLDSFVRSFHALGQHHFIFVPFFISAQGAIGSALVDDLGNLQSSMTVPPFQFSITEGLAASGIIPAIVAERIRAVIALRELRSPPVIIVDHGGPSARSSALRDELATKVRAVLGHEVSGVSAASMEGSHPPLLAEQLRAPALAGRDVVVAPLFLSPGRHAGPGGDVPRICEAAPARCHLTELVGSHPHVVEALAAALLNTLSTRTVPTFA